MKNKSPEYYFKQLYRDLNKRERKGKITNLHFTKFVNFPNAKYIWVANHDYTIGAYPIHYENFLPQYSGIYKTNAWYRLNGDTGVELKSKIVTDVLKHLNRIVSLTEGALVKEIDKIWS